MAIYLKYGSVDGEVTESSHLKWIEIGSLQWGVGRGISVGTGGGSKRESSAPAVSEITLTKTFDVSSPLLLKEALAGAGVDVKIHITRTDSKGNHTAFQKYLLSDTMISGYSVSSGGDRPSESLSLNFVKIDSEYIGVDSKFKPTSTGHVVYDLSVAKLT